MSVMAVARALNLDPAFLLALAVALPLLLLAWLALRRVHARTPPPGGQAAKSVPFESTRKIVVFYSSIGHGHIRAAQAIQQEIVRLAPATQVVLQDIREFMHPLWRRIDERLYWFIVGHLPDSFDALFHALQLRGNRIPSLAWLPNDYPQDKVRAFLEAQSPGCVLATHYGSAQVLASLREQGLLTQVRIGWLHTDFFEGYFPRISKRIDCTFLAHRELAARWTAAGVSDGKIAISGMPLTDMADLSGSAPGTHTLPELAPGVPTVLITGGKQGVGDYAAIVKSLASRHPDALQIVAACGLNTRQQGRLAALRSRLPQAVAVKVFGLLSHADLLAYMRAADVVITKAGGMTPAEAFAANVPVILLDAIRGHERENAAFFDQQGVAELAADPAQAGELAAAVLSDHSRQAAMRQAQQAFQQQADIRRIARFALDPGPHPPGVPADFGAEQGSAIADIGATLARLESESPCDIELLLSYSTARTPQRVVLENPFGHLAIRIDDKVYSANHVATPGHQSNLLQHLTLADYLYGVNPPSPNQVHTNTYGMAYGRETLGLRIAGVPKQRKAAMIAEAQMIEEEFRQGDLLWHRSRFNCADVVVRIAAAGGYHRSPHVARKWLPVMPLDIFDEASQICDDDRSLRTELVAYRQIPGTQAIYQFARFPLSLGQPVRSMVRIVRDSACDPLEVAVAKQVIGSCGDCRLHFEDLRDIGANCADGNHLQCRLARALVADLRRLLPVDVPRPGQTIQSLVTSSANRNIRRLLNRGLASTRITLKRLRRGVVLRHRKRNPDGQASFGALPHWSGAGQRLRAGARPYRRAAGHRGRRHRHRIHCRHQHGCAGRRGLRRRQTE